MTEFKHWVLTPEEVARDKLMRDDYDFAHALFRSWVSELTGSRPATLYPSQTCHGLMGYWEPQPSGHSKRPLGITVLSEQTIDFITAKAQNDMVPEPVTTINLNGGSSSNRIGYGVVGMGQNFEVIFYSGGEAIHPTKLPTPDGFWILKNTSMTTPITKT